MGQAHLDTLRKNYDELVARKVQACMYFANTVNHVDMSASERKAVMNAFAECLDAQQQEIESRNTMLQFEEYMNG